MKHFHCSCEWTYSLINYEAKTNTTTSWKYSLTQSLTALAPGIFSDDAQVFWAKKLWISLMLWMCSIRVLAVLCLFSRLLHWPESSFIFHAVCWTDLHRCQEVQIKSVATAHHISRRGLKKHLENEDFIIMMLIIQLSSRVYSSPRQNLGFLSHFSEIMNENTNFSFTHG